MFLSIGGNVSGKQAARRLAPGEAVACFGARGWVSCIYEQAAETGFLHRLFTSGENNEGQQFGEPGRLMPGMHPIPLVIAEYPKEVGLRECIVKVFCRHP